MTTIQSFPARHQQHVSAKKSFIFNPLYHFGLKTKTSRLFTWCTWLQFIHFLVILACVNFGYWSPLIRINSIEKIESSLSAINSSSRMYTDYEWTFAKRCSLSPLISVDNIDSYTDMNLINTILCIVSVLLIIPAQWLFNDVSRNDLENPYRWFCWCRKILIYLVISSISNQLASATACRPIEIFYDLRYISMIMVQIVGFFICLLFAFFLGVKFASVKAAHRLLKST